MNAEDLTKEPQEHGSAVGRKGSKFPTGYLAAAAAAQTAAPTELTISHIPGAAQRLLRLALDGRDAKVVVFACRLEVSKLCRGRGANGSGYCGREALATGRLAPHQKAPSHAAGHDQHEIARKPRRSVSPPPYIRVCRQPAAASAACGNPAVARVARGAAWATTSFRFW